jgi:hypothetical protein
MNILVLPGKILHIYWFGAAVQLVAQGRRSMRMILALHMLSGLLGTNTKKNFKN